MKGANWFAIFMATMEQWTTKVKSTTVSDWPDFPITKVVHTA